MLDGVYGGSWENFNHRAIIAIQFQKVGSVQITVASRKMFLGSCQVPSTKHRIPRRFLDYKYFAPAPIAFWS